MKIRQLIIVLILIPSIFFGSTPLVAKADSSLSTEERIQLLLKIKNLLEEVLGLQQQLEVISSTNTTRAPYQSKFFFFPYEAIYFVDNLKLVNSDGSNSVRSDDEKLFDLFVGVVGENEVDGLVSEWRIFYDDEVDTGAYVESTNNMTSWIVGVNRENYNTTYKGNLNSFANLFIHEYSHILLTKYKNFKNNYEETFWTEEDQENKSLIDQRESEDYFNLTNSYYQKNKNRFVSDYATLSPEEDLAETFVFFVREQIPVGDSVKDKKIRYFYTEADLVEERNRLRNNLLELNVL